MWHQFPPTYTTPIHLFAFNLSIVALQCCVSIVLYNNVMQRHAYIYPLLHEPPSHHSHPF